MLRQRGTIWCKEPVAVTVKGGKITFESDKGEIVVKDDAGRNLAEAFRYGSKNYFPPTGENPELLYFAAPQYNTWIELTYHQNEKDILAYAQSMLDNGLPPGVFMIDDTWQHGYGEWHFDARRFSDPKGMMDKLHLTKIKPGVAQSRVFRIFANRMAIRFHAHFRHDCISKLAGVG